MTKTDLAPLPDFVEEYRKLGVRILTSSSKAESQEANLSIIKEILSGKTSVLVGHSGVGKSTLINALVPHAGRITGIVNTVTGRGRHTSSSAIALPLSSELKSHDGWIIDTPGIRAFGLAHLDSNRIIAAFPEIAEVTQGCLPHCTHYEPSCRLNEWIAPDGVIDQERLIRVTSLRSLLELKDKNPTLSE
jgi:ribosome biogenesis GTPase